MVIENTKKDTVTYKFILFWILVLNQQILNWYLIRDILNLNKRLLSIYNGHQLKLLFFIIYIKVLISTAILHITDEEAYPIKISGIGKYPYLDLSNKKIDFEPLLVGKKKVNIW